VTAIQLNVDQVLGDYSGYSGAPIQQEEIDSSITLVGMLIEQTPDSVEKTRATNVLWAISAKWVVDEFETDFGTDLFDLLARGAEADRRDRITRWARAGARDLGYALEGLEAYAMEAGANPAAVTLLKARLPSMILSVDGGRFDPSA
jgi:hypothetical protein